VSGDGTNSAGECASGRKAGAQGFSAAGERERVACRRDREERRWNRIDETRQNAMLKEPESAAAYGSSAEGGVDGRLRRDRRQAAS
jgi:hypothetical protein